MVPFKSERQRRYLYSQKPEVARKFAAHEPVKRAVRRRKTKRMGDYR